MNEKVLQLREFMADPQGWGRVEGRRVYQRILEYVEANPGALVFRISLKGVRRIDISFASETIVEVARRYRSAKGFSLFDLDDQDMLENIEAAASKKNQPLGLLLGNERKMIGVEPSRGTRDALSFALARMSVRAAEFAEAVPSVSIANASTKFKQLWEQGFLLRREHGSETGGVEYIYLSIV